MPDQKAIQPPSVGDAGQRELPKGNLYRALNLVFNALLILGAVVAIGMTAYGIGRYGAMAEFRKDALNRGYAWHTREKGEWVWKTPEEVLEASLHPLVESINLDVQERQLNPR